MEEEEQLRLISEPKSKPIEKNENINFENENSWSRQKTQETDKNLDVILMEKIAENIKRSNIKCKSSERFVSLKRIVL